MQAGRLDLPGRARAQRSCHVDLHGQVRFLPRPAAGDDELELLGLELRVAHYPPYCSKYNAIEHRLFPHVTRACRGVVFVSVPLVKQLMEKAKTKTGLWVTVDIIAAEYATGLKAPVGLKENMPLVFDDLLPKWNYRALPQREGA